MIIFRDGASKTKPCHHFTSRDLRLPLPSSTLLVIDSYCPMSTDCSSTVAVHPPIAFFFVYPVTTSRSAHTPIFLCEDVVLGSPAPLSEKKERRQSDAVIDKVTNFCKIILGREKNNSPKINITFM
jgi:hypothetical protein